MLRTCNVQSTLLALLISSLLPSSLSALPSVEGVAHGSAHISTQGNELLIQASDRAILNYQSFNIQTHETVRFQMPDSSSRILNRIEGSGKSHIDGQLLSNGIVYLMNPAGIIFGPDCTVNVAALYAAAAHLSDSDFIQGHDHFKGIKGSIEIYGSLTAQEIALIGQKILQEGTVLTEEGHIFYGTAEDVYLGRKDGYLFFKGDKEAFHEPEEPGYFLACGDPESMFIHHSGVTKAKKIHLYAEKNSEVHVSGSLDASQHAENSLGGEIYIQGEVIKLEGAHVDASGTVGGGTVLVGGGMHGDGLYPTAKYTGCDSNTIIQTDATQMGDGGQIVLWSDKLTLFDAKLFSRGGAQGGDGGFIETSSGNSFYGTTGRVDTSAAKGKLGQWALDPHSITIVNGSTNNPPGLTLADLNNSTPANLDATASAALLESAVSNIIMAATVPNPPDQDNTFISLGTAMASATVNITNPNVGVVINTNGGPNLNGTFFTNGSFTTTGAISVSAPVVVRGPTVLGSTAGSINFSLPINSDPSTPNQNLTLNAQGGVIFSGAIGNTHPLGILSIQSPGANVQCHANITTSGNIIFNSLFVTLNNPLTITSSGGGIDFVGQVNSDTPASNRNLTLSATGEISFRSSVGLNPVGDLLIQNAGDVHLYSQPDPNIPAHTLTARSFTQTAGTGNTEFEGPLITFGAPVAQAGGTAPTAPRDGGNVSITTSGAINFYYLVQHMGSSDLTPVLVPIATDTVAFKSVITTTGGRQSSSVSTVGNPNAPNGLKGGSVTLNGSTINLLGIYAGGTPAFPGSSGTGGAGGNISVTSTGGTILRGPIIATGGAGANGGAQDLPSLIFSGQNLNAAGADSPGSITINGPLTLGFNGIVLRGSNITIGAVQSSGSNLLAIDGSTASTVSLGALTNLSYLVIDYAKGVAVTGPVQAGGLDLFNAGSGQIVFQGAVTSTDVQAIANNFCAVFQGGLTTATQTRLNCGCSSPPTATPPQESGFAGVFAPSSGNAFGSSSISTAAPAYSSVPPFRPTLQQSLNAGYVHGEETAL